MARDDDDNRTGEMFEYIEDAEGAGGPQDPEKALTDEELEEGGLVQAKTWIRTRQTRNALRVKKHQERQAEQGVKQVNIQAPEEVHDALKAVAKRVRSGEDPGQAFAAIAGDALPESDQKVLTTLRRGGWRARLIRFLTS